MKINTCILNQSINQSKHSTTGLGMNRSGWFSSHPITEYSISEFD